MRRGAVVLLALSACVHVEQDLRLAPDGSGTLAVAYTMSRSAIEAFEDQARAEAEAAGEEAPGPLEFDEAEIRADFEELRPLGIELEDVQVADAGDSRSVKLRIRFASLAALSQTEFLSDRRIRLERLEDGSMLLVQSASALPPAGAEMNEMIRELMAGFRAVLTIETPSDILETNADESDARRATWVFDFDKDPSAVERAQQLDLRVRFAAVDPPMPEFPARE